MSEPRFHLFHFPEHGPSLAVRYLLEEYNIAFQTHEINLLGNKQLEEWYLESISKVGEVPILLDQKTKRLVSDYTYILNYIYKTHHNETDQLSQLSNDDRTKYAELQKILLGLPKESLTYRFMSKSAYIRTSGPGNSTGASSTHSCIATLGTRTSVNILNAILDYRIKAISSVSELSKLENSTGSADHFETYHASLRVLKDTLNSDTQLQQIYETLIIDLNSINSILSNNTAQSYVFGADFTTMDALLASAFYDMEKNGLAFLLPKYPAIMQYYSFIKSTNAFIRATENYPITLDLVFPLYKMLGTSLIKSKKTWAGFFSATAIAIITKSLATNLLSGGISSLFSLDQLFSTSSEIMVYF